MTKSQAVISVVPGASLPPPSNSNVQYSPGFCLGGRLSPITAVTTAGPGTLLTAVLMDPDAQNAPIDLYLYNVDTSLTSNCSSTGMVTDHMPFSPPSCVPVGVVTFADYATPPSGAANTYSVATLRSIGLTFIAPTNGQLWPILVMRGNATYRGTVNNIQYPLVLRFMFDVG